MKKGKKVAIDFLVSELSRYKAEGYKFVVFQEGDSNGWLNILKFRYFDEMASSEKDEVCMLF